MLRYQDSIKQKIEASRKYPIWAQKRGIEGVTYLCFKLFSSGEGNDIRIVNTSGSGILDNEAVATIINAQPFPPFPPEIRSNSILMEVAIVFSLNKKS